MKLFLRTAALIFLGLVSIRPDAAWSADLIRVGEGPFITGGGFFVAKAKGYFEKAGLDVEMKSYIDGALAVPSMVAGELDISFMTPNAALFNSISRGAPLVLILDRGNNKTGRAYTAISVTKALYDRGVKTIADFAQLKGKKIGLSATGSINQYTMALALQKAGLDPRTDVKWITNVPQPDLMKMLGQNEIDATNLAYQFSYFAEKNGWGPVVEKDDEVDPNGQIGLYAARKDFVQKKRDVLVRFAMAYLQGVKEFNAAAIDPDGHKDIVDIFAKSTALSKPEVVKAIAPNWSYASEDGMPNVQSVMKMQDYWADYFKLVDKKLTEAQLFDLSIAQEADSRLGNK